MIRGRDVSLSEFEFGLAMRQPLSGSLSDKCAVTEKV